MLSKIYPQQIHGFYRRIKDQITFVLLSIYFITPWLRYHRSATPTNQAIMIDLPNRKAYFFAIEIGPEEAYFLTATLITAALGLFLTTMLFGRIWCGYTCVHTVFVDIFRKIEHYFQGDRNQQIALDGQPFTKHKFYKKLLTHCAWLAASFSFAFGWVCYFYDAPQLTKDLINLQVTPNAFGWLTGLTFTTYLFAGFMREKVCMHMCPYGRFQSIMLDNDSKIVTYHNYRGEPRGKIDEVSGDCINCYKCVNVCPMGIDIRDGLQMSCINCGLCIDACDSVMDALDRPLGLISYDSVNSSLAKQNQSISKQGIISKKAVTFFAVILICISGIITGLLTKTPYSVDIIRESGTLSTMLPDGSIRNTYMLHLNNKSESIKKFTFTLNPLYAQFMVQGYSTFGSTFIISLSPQEVLSAKLFIKASNVDTHKSELTMTIQTDSDTSVINKKLTFFTR